MSGWNTALVTGGGSGIGRRLAELLLARGVSVAVLDRDAPGEAAQQLQALAQRRPDTRCCYLQVDVTDAAGVVDAVNAAIAALGAPDLVINSAGVQDARPLAEQDAAAFRRLVEINLFGSRNVAAAVLPHMRPGAQLALVASLAGLVPSYAYTAYNASKFGVVGLAGALRLEYIASGIEVSVICPPEVNTPMVEVERRTLPPVAAKLKDTAGTLEVGPACDYMLRQLQRRRFLIIPGWRARQVARLARWMPWLMRYISESTVRREAR
ncbi:MAG: SDR family NAD(P)-dependent oxidoreductase [Halioglobus sp.]|nr:SDR family NAD(P)-dependent oxidoreductase [Halioglobus sp.]